MENMSRRSFLRNTLVGAAGLAATGILGTIGAVAEGKTTYNPGTYRATAKGISSDVTVTMTFDAEAITDVQIDVSGETAGLGADIGPEMVKKLLDAQSSDVDGVSSCTVTSNAIREAAAQCIADAKGVELVKVKTEVETGTEPHTSWMKAPEEVTEFEAEYDADAVTAMQALPPAVSWRSRAIRLFCWKRSRRTGIKPSAMSLLL